MLCCLHGVDSVSSKVFVLLLMILLSLANQETRDLSGQAASIIDLSCLTPDQLLHLCKFIQSTQLIYSTLLLAVEHGFLWWKVVVVLTWPSVGKKTVVRVGVTVRMNNKNSSFFR